MSQPFTLRATNRRSPLRIGQIIFTVLALVVFALGSLYLSLVWFSAGVTTVGKDIDAEASGRGFVFVIVWSVIILAVWIFSTGALLLAKRWVLASISLPVAFAVFYGILYFVARLMLATSGVMFTAFFILLNTGAIWLASWFLRSTSR